MIFIQDRSNIQSEYYKRSRNSIHKAIPNAKDYYKHIFPLQFINEGDVVVQCGFHNKLISWGVSQAIIMSHLVGEYGTVLAVDAVPKNIKKLCEYIKENNISNTIIAEHVVWSKDEKIDFIQFDTNQNIAKPVLGKIKGSMHSEGSGGKPKLVDALSLDTIVNRYCNKKIDFINLTINGAEEDVLKGSEKIIENNENVKISIALKTNKNWLYQTRKPVIDRLIDMGYHIIVADAPPLPWGDTFLFACAVKEIPDNKFIRRASESEIKKIL